MKKSIYIMQDMVSHAVADTFCAENDASVCRMIASIVRTTPKEQMYIVRDAVCYRLGDLVQDDNTGSLRILPVQNPVLVCRGQDLIAQVSYKEGDDNEMD